MLRNARPESARNQWPNWSGKRNPAVPAVVSPCIGNIKMPHKLRQIRLGCLYKEMKVIPHQHVGVKSYPVDIQGGLKLLQAQGSVLVVPIDVSSLVAPAGDVVEGVRVVDPKGPGHDRSCHQEGRMSKV